MSDKNSDSNDIKARMPSSDRKRSRSRSRLLEIRQRRLELTSGGSSKSSVCSSNESKPASRTTAGTGNEEVINKRQASSPSPQQSLHGDVSRQSLMHQSSQNRPQNAKETTCDANMAKEVENSLSKFRHNSANIAKNQISNIQSTITALTSTLANSLITARAELTSAKDKLNQLQQILRTKRNAHQTELNAANGRIATLEREIDSFSQKVANYNECISLRLKEKDRLQLEVSKWKGKAQVSTGAVGDYHNMPNNVVQQSSKPLGGGISAASTNVETEEELAMIIPEEASDTDKNMLAVLVLQHWGQSIPIHNRYQRLLSITTIIQSLQRWHHPQSLSPKTSCGKDCHVSSHDDCFQKRS